MSRQRKIQLTETGELIMDTGVKQIQRTISKQNAINIPAGIVSIEYVDAELTAYLSDGWKLLSSHFIGENPEGFLFWYVLVKQ